MYLVSKLQWEKMVGCGIQAKKRKKGETEISKAALVQLF